MDQVKDPITTLAADCAQQNGVASRQEILRVVVCSGYERKKPGFADMNRTRDGT